MDVPDQPAPVKSEGDIWLSIIEDANRMDGADAFIAHATERRVIGIERYKTPLQAHNGRDWAIDFYQELLDACAYSKQGVLEGHQWACFWYGAVLSYAIEFSRQIQHRQERKQE